MSLGDPIGDMLTRIRNGQMRSLNKIEIPFSNFRSKILEVLKREGYIISYEITTNDKKIKNIFVNAPIMFFVCFAFYLLFLVLFFFF